MTLFRSALFICSAVALAHIGTLDGDGGKAALGRSQAGISHGTTVIIYWTPKAIYAAADSREVSLLATEGGYQTSSTNVCKIRSFSQFSVAAAGITKSIDGFELFSALEREYRPSESMNVYVAGALAETRADLLRALNQWNAADPQGFDGQFLNRVALSITAFGTERGQSRVVNGAMTLVRDSRGALQLQDKTLSCPEQCAPTGYMMSGMYTAIEPLLRGDPHYFLARPFQRHPELGLVHLLDTQAVAEPRFVGGPSSILKIEKSNTTWLERGACMEQPRS